MARRRISESTSLGDELSDLALTLKDDLVRVPKEAFPSSVSAPPKAFLTRAVAV